MRVNAGPFRPDQPTFQNEGLLQADGCYKIANGYAPIPQFAALQNGTLAAAPIGGGAYRYAATPYIFVGTTTNVYTYSASGFTSVQSGLSTTVSNGLRFCPYGKYMLITNGTDPIKQFDPASPSALSTLSASAPTARYMAVIRGVLMTGYPSGNSLRLSWSDNGNPAGWTVGGSSISGTFDMPSGGDITGIVGGEYGLIFQEYRIVRATYTGDSTIWQWDEVLTDIGCTVPKSLATVGKVSFFWSNRGFMAFDGASVQPIGNEKVDRYFQALMDRNYTDYVSAVIDPVRSLYIVTIPSSSPPASALVYNYQIQEWTTAPITSPLMFSALSLSVSIDQIDAIYGNLDAITLSLDSNSLRGGFPSMYLFNGSNMLGQLSGSPMAATFKDGLKELIPGRRSRISSARPLTDGMGLSLTIGTANNLGSTPSETTYTTVTGSGIFRTRSVGNFSQFKWTIPAGTQWTWFQGDDRDAVDGGRA